MADSIIPAALVAQRPVRAILARRRDDRAELARAGLADPQARRVASPATPEVDLKRFVKADARVVSGARRHEDPDVRAAPGGMREGGDALPGDRRVPRRTRGSDHAGFTAVAQLFVDRGLRARAAERARLERLRQDVAARRRRPEAARRDHRHRGRAKFIRSAWAKDGARRRSASSAAATAATRC